MEPEKVYIIIESKSEDYHGTYHEAMEVHKNFDSARQRVKELNEENYNYNIDYFVDTYILIN